MYWQDSYVIWSKAWHMASSALHVASNTQLRFGVFRTGNGWVGIVVYMQ